MTDIIFKGSIGKVGGVYHHSRNPNSPVVLVIGTSSSKIVNGKSPKKGAISFEKVTDAVYDVFVKNDFSVLKFNFKDYEPIEDPEKGEMENLNLLDMTAALDWLHNRNIECRSFWICALDYAVVTMLQLVMRRPELENYVVISPNLKKTDFSFVIPCSACGLIVRGSEDLKFTEDDGVMLQEKLTTKAESKIKYLTIYKAGRNFENQMEEFQNELSEYVREKTLEDRKNLKHVTASKRRRRKKKFADAEEEKIIYINPIKTLDIDDI